MGALLRAIPLKALNSGSRYEMELNIKPIPSSSILLVEDDEVTLQCYIIILSKKYPDVRFHSAIDGKMGLELFKTFLPEIVITDINMPEMCGAQLADKIHAIKPDTQFIVLTGDSEKKILHDSAGNGYSSVHYLVKPVNFETFFTSIEQCLREIGQQT
jgi:YesN/AraC family two-component response regulator